MAKAKNREDVQIPVTNDLTFKEETETPPMPTPAPVDASQYTETSFGLARKKVDIGTPEERVRTFLVEVKYNPEDGKTLPAIMTEMDDISSAIREFKIKTVKNVLKI